jgi:hypothetical protein
MNKLFNSYLWIPDIMRLSGYLNEKKKEKKENELEKTEEKCEKKNKPCKNSKIKFVIGKGRYVYWNFKPNMIIDLDWIELNNKQPINVILLEKRKK